MKEYPSQDLVEQREQWYLRFLQLLAALRDAVKTGQHGDRTEDLLKCIDDIENAQSRLQRSLSIAACFFLLKCEEEECVLAKNFVKHVREHYSNQQ